MNPIQEAIEEIESREPGDEISYHEVAKKLKKKLELTEQRCRGDTEVFSARVKRSSASDYYSTHNRS